MKTGSPLGKKKDRRKKNIFNIVLKKLRLFSLGPMMKACKLELYSVAHKSHETRDLLRHIHPLRTQYFLKGRDNSCNNKQRPQTVTAHRLLNASLYLQKMFSVLRAVYTSHGTVTSETTQGFQQTQCHTYFQTATK